MRRSALSLGGWLAAVCVVASAVWACSSGETNPFDKGSRRQQGGSSGTDPGGGGTSGSTSGTDTGGANTGGTSGPSTGGEATGGMTTGGGTNEGGAAADSGNDTGGTTTGGTPGTGGAAGAGAGGAGMGGSAGTPATGGAGMSGAGAGAGMGGAGMSGSGGMPGDCKLDTDCDDDEYCKKASCDDAESGHCTALGPQCTGDDAVFDPVCGCNGVTYWNTCVIESAGFNILAAGECTGNNRPTCTRDEGGAGCPSEYGHQHCYRPVEMCGDPSPLMGYCWGLPAECPPNEPQTERYCGGTGGEMRCIGLCEVLEAENSFRRDSPLCD